VVVNCHTMPGCGGGVWVWGVWVIEARVVGAARVKGSTRAQKRLGQELRIAKSDLKSLSRRHLKTGRQNCLWLNAWRNQKEARDRPWWCCQPATMWGDGQKARVFVVWLHSFSEHCSCMDPKVCFRDEPSAKNQSKGTCAGWRRVQHVSLRQCGAGGLHGCCR